MTEAEKAYQYFVIAVPENEEQAKAYFWARKALRPTLTPPNEPLTIEQLREMVGEPVYDYLGQEWSIIQEYYDHELLMTDGTSFEDDDELDRVDERFYRRPPEGEEDT